jgi:hypothetical protein
MYFQNSTNHPFVNYFLKLKKLDRSYKIRLFLYYVTETGIPKKDEQYWLLAAVSSTVQCTYVYVITENKD